jgi:hypothetical protein
MSHLQLSRRSSIFAHTEGYVTIPMATTHTLEPDKGQPIEHAESVHVSDKLDPGAAKTGARNVALAEALAIENARPFRKSFIKLYMCLFVAYMCSSTNGFDANTFGEPSTFL